MRPNYTQCIAEKQSNVSHIHAILRTLFDISTPDGLRQVLDKIRGCVADLIRLKDAHYFTERGFMSSVEQLVEILETAKKFLTHHCHERCQIPKIDANGNTVFVCKVQDNYMKTLTPSIHSLKGMRVHHTPEAKKIYNRLGFLREDTPTTNLMRSERHIPICSSSDPKFSPTNGHLFVCFPSSQNLQFPTSYALSAYLVRIQMLHEVSALSRMLLT